MTTDQEVGGSNPFERTTAIIPGGRVIAVKIDTDDGVRLDVRDTGSGDPILFLHEFAGDQRSWEPQVGFFAGSYRCITYAARGYPPSDVPTDPKQYSQQRAVADAVAVLDALSLPRAHIVGLSMGGFCGLHLALGHPDRVSTLVIAGVGYGAEPERRTAFRDECELLATGFLTDGAEHVASTYAEGPTRVQLKRKNPVAWRTFASQLASHSELGSALTMRGIQASRPSLYDLQADLEGLRVATLLLVGDEDAPALVATRMLARTIPGAALTVVPRTGHTINLEEPEVFNQLVLDFLSVASGS